MKIYRVGAFSASENHTGYSYHSSRADAKKAMREMIKSDEDQTEYTLEAREFPISKAGMLAALSHFGSHNDNG